MSKGFLDFSIAELEFRIEQELDEIEYSFTSVKVLNIDEFSIEVLISGNISKMYFKYNALSEFGKYSGAYTKNIIDATMPLFEFITQDAEKELEVL